MKMSSIQKPMLTVDASARFVVTGEDSYLHTIAIYFMSVCHRVVYVAYTLCTLRCMRKGGNCALFSSSFTALHEV